MGKKLLADDGDGRSSGEGNDDPLQNSCLQNSTDRGAWQAGYSPWGLQESDMTEHPKVTDPDSSITAS